MSQSRWIKAGLLAAKLVVALAAATAFNVATARAAASDAAGGLRGEWKRAGAGFTCIVETKKRPPPAGTKPEILARACQHLGPFVVGDDASKVKALLGAPFRTLPQPNGNTAWIYFVEQQDHHPYLIVTVAKSRVVALQITGPVAAKDYDFNHIGLGLPASELLAQFGSPSHIEPSDVKETELWSYNPWPFSFEVSADRVTSIRIAQP
jgi:hypothetical protein